MSQDQTITDLLGLQGWERVRLRMRGIMDESSDREARLKPAHSERCDAMRPHGLKPVSDGGAG